MIDDIELRQLRALQAVAREGSFGRAAERLGFTQSAVSQQIAALEKAVGERLFDRPGGPRRVELTPAGQVLLEHADAISERVRSADDALRSLRAGEVGRLVVGSFQSVSVKVLPDVIGRLRAERPGLTIRCVENDLKEVLLQQLLDGELDLTFMVERPDDPAFESVELCTDPYVLLSPSTERRASVPLADLRGAPMIGYHVSSCQLLLETGLRRHGIQPDYVFRTNDNMAVQAMVRAGMGCAVQPYLAIDPADPDVTISQLDPPLDPRVIALVRRRGRSLPPAAERFVELASEVCERLARFSPRTAATALAS